MQVLVVQMLCKCSQRKFGMHCALIACKCTLLLCLSLEGVKQLIVLCVVCAVQAHRLSSAICCSGCLTRTQQRASNGRCVVCTAQQTAPSLPPAQLLHDCLLLHCGWPFWQLCDSQVFKVHTTHAQAVHKYYQLHPGIEKLPSHHYITRAVWCMHDLRGLQEFVKHPIWQMRLSPAPEHCKPFCIVC
jgi:hypothetical protein